MSRRLTGTLYLRGKTWWLKYWLAGKCIRESLNTDDEKRARIERDRIIGPLLARTAEEQVRVIGRRILDAGQSALDLQNRERIPVERAWEMFPYANTVRGKRRATRPLSPRVQLQNAQIWRAFAGACKRQYMDQVTAADAIRYSEALRAGRTGKTHLIHVQVLGVVFRQATGANPFSAVPLYQHVPESRQHLEPDQLLKVAAGATGELRLLVLALTYTGLRLGDAINLRWGTDIDLANDRIIKRTAKTGAVVAFPILPPLRRELEQTPAGDRQGLLMPALAARYALNQSGVSRTILRLIQRACGVRGTAEVEGKRGVAQFGAHSFRHSFITLCARAGVPIAAVAAWVGHSPLVDRIYQHWGVSDFARLIGQALPDAERK